MKNVFGKIDYKTKYKNSVGVSRKFSTKKVNVYLRQQKLHDIKVSKAKMTIEEKETVSCPEILAQILC